MFPVLCLVKLNGRQAPRVAFRGHRKSSSLGAGVMGQPL